MAHPSSYYIKLLMSEDWAEELDEDGVDESRESLNKTLFSYGLPAILEDEYTLQLLALRPPDNFNPANKKHRDTVVFMKDEGLYTLWNPKKEDKRVLSFLLSQQRARIKIDIMLMGGVPFAVIAKRINREYNYREPITVGMLDTYRHFFWNTDLPGPREWNNLLAGHPHRDALLAAYYDGPDQALYRVGGNPKIGDPKKPLREANRQTYFTLTALRFKPDSGETISQRSRLVADLRALHDAIYGEGADHAALLKQFRQFLVIKTPSSVKEWDNIVGGEGSHSGDGKDYDDDDSNADA